MSNYGISKIPTPVYNQDKGLEFIAFPGTKFAYREETCDLVQVTTNEYPTKDLLFIDPRCLQQMKSEPTERKKELPPAKQILNFMQSLVGVRYLWGGNWAAGIPELLDFFPGSTSEDALCKGVDCSGLLFQATNGFTPRNTSQLIHYGRELPLNCSVQPLDMLVWSGHVLFILNPENTIESLSGKGVIISPFASRFAQVCEKTKTEKKTLFLRRWHPEFLELD